jgi:hypothetical protein
VPLSNMRQPLIYFALIMCLCAACSSTPRYHQAGKTEAETERDYKDCEKLTRDRYGSRPNQDSPHFRADLDSCMESKGYQRE